MTFSPDDLPRGGLAWLDGGGAESDVVLATRVRLARNIEGYAFPGRARGGESLRVLSQVRDALDTIPGLSGGSLVRVDRLPCDDRALLHERHIVSKELAALGSDDGPRDGAAVHVNTLGAVMINEEDHLRIQSLRAGLDLDAALGDAMALDRELGDRLPYAYHHEFGFLTACPTNVGTGLRASVLVHLPALVLTKEIARVLAGLQQVGLTYRGLYGEGSDVVGNLFQISNQTTLGQSEDQLVGYLDDVVRHVVQKEQEARTVLLRDAEYILEDKLWRAFGALRYARRLSFDEGMSFLSAVRLGAGLKLIDTVSVSTLNALLVFMQPAHVAARAGRALDASEENVARAMYVRQTLDGTGA